MHNNDEHLCFEEKVDFPIYISRGNQWIIICYYKHLHFLSGIFG